MPVNATVTLKIYSSDVVHSWWVPKLGGKADAVPGHTNETWFRAEEEGTYEGTCAELCGEGHADMRTRVVVLPADEYEAWAEQQTADIKEAQDGPGRAAQGTRGDRSGRRRGDSRGAEEDHRGGKEPAAPAR